MATDRKAVGLCDICGFKYPHRILQINIYHLMFCPTDFEGAFDLKNHPQNKAPNVKDDESIRNPRPPLNNDRNLLWEATTTEWEDTDQNWNMI